MAVAGFLILAFGLLMILPRGFTGGSSYSRITPVSDSYIETTPGFRDEPGPWFSWKRTAAGLAVAAVGVVLLVFGL